MGVCNSQYASPRALDDREKVSLDMFMFQSILGEGGFGKVMCGVFVHTDQWHAVKVIGKRKILNLRTGQKMLYNELTSLKNISAHPFICGLHYAFQDSLSCYLVLDLKKGGDLRFYLEGNPHLFDERDVAIYVSCLSSALEHIHHHGVIHRDVKPDNIILDSNGFPCLSDFGVAYVSMDKGPLLCTLASGTKAYLAPEVFTTSHLHGPECDYWGLGVVAHEMLYGERPYEKKVPKQFVIYAESLITDQQKDAAYYPQNQQHQSKKRKQDETSLAEQSQGVSKHQLRFDDEQKPSSSSSHNSSNRDSSSRGSSSSHSSNIHAHSASSEIDTTGGMPVFKPRDVIHTEDGNIRVSHACIEVIQGLLDIRPSYRYGGDNIGRFFNHTWFIEHHINHEAVMHLHESMKPKFQPGSDFIRSTCLNQHHYAIEDATSEYNHPIDVLPGGGQEEKEHVDVDEHEFLSSWEQQRFHDFYYCRAPF